MVEISGHTSGGGVIMSTRFCGLFVLTALAVALTLPAAAHAITGYTIDGLRVVHR